ncbi:MAG: site-2 protease family protein, partial [Parasphingorhabdus sp.]
MTDNPGILLTLLAFLIVIGVLVFVHEMGHYLVGRWCGVKAETFSIGFGKEIAGWTDKR